MSNHTDHTHTAGQAHAILRWAEAFCDLLEEKGFTSRAEIEARMAAMKAELEARP